MAKRVILYESLPDRDVCINAWLVKEGQAVSLHETGVPDSSSNCC